MKIVLDTRVERATFASLHEYFSKQTIGITKSALGNKVFETLYKILLSNNLLTPHTEATADHYIQKIENRRQAKVDLSHITIPKGLNSSERTTVGPSKEEIEESLGKLKSQIGQTEGETHE